MWTPPGNGCYSMTEWHIALSTKPGKAQSWLSGEGLEESAGLDLLLSPTADAEGRQDAAKLPLGYTERDRNQSV
jgi:hypothetical protein